MPSYASNNFNAVKRYFNSLIAGYGVSSDVPTAQEFLYSFFKDVMRFIERNPPTEFFKHAAKFFPNGTFYDFLATDIINSLFDIHDKISSGKQTKQEINSVLSSILCLMFNQFPRQLKVLETLQLWECYNAIKEMYQAFLDNHIPKSLQCEGRIKAFATSMEQQKKNKKL